MDLVTQLRFSRCILDARSMSMTTSVVAFTASVLMPREPRRHATQAHGGRLQPTEIPIEQMIHTFSLLFRDELARTTSARGRLSPPPS